jgi:hypothetical protein
MPARAARQITVILLTCLIFGLSISSAASVSAESFTGDEPAKQMGAGWAQSMKLPLSFIPNVGQSAPEVQFQARGLGGNLYFTP